MKQRKQCVGDIVDGDAVDGDKRVLGPFSKRSGEVEDVFNGGWLRIDVVDGRDRGETIGSENVDVE